MIPGGRTTTGPRAVTRYQSPLVLRGLFGAASIPLEQPFQRTRANAEATTRRVKLQERNSWDQRSTLPNLAIVGLSFRPPEKTGEAPADDDEA